MEQKVIVLGAGVIGLSSAVCIKQAFPHVDVEIVAEKFTPHTLSDGSGGFWEPYALGKTDPGLIRDMSQETHTYLKRLAYSAEAGEAGANALSGYSLYTSVVKTLEPFHDVVDGYRMLTPEEVMMFPQAQSGYFHTTLQLDVATYLPWLTKKFKSMGGKLRCAKVLSLDEFRGQCSVVVNCCGIGAKELLNDDDIIPVKGQVMRVRAPWLKHFYILKPAEGFDLAYILPGAKNVVIGGTAEKGNWSTEPKPDVADKIWKAATDFLPMLKKAEIIRSWADLRPVRSRLRLEREEISSSGNLLKVVHNYGHGGSGVTLHWGCALRATEMVRQELLNSGSCAKAKL